MSLLEQVLLHCHRILDHSQICILMSFIGFRKLLIIYFLQIVLLPHYLFGRPITYMLELFTMSQNPTYLSYCLYFLIFSLCFNLCNFTYPSLNLFICSSVLKLLFNLYNWPLNSVGTMGTLPPHLAQKLCIILIPTRMNY